VDYSWITAGKVSVVCVGNELNGDDGFGKRLYDRIEDLGSPRLQVIYASTAPENFIDEILEFSPDLVAVFDAADFGGKPGEVRELSLGDLESTSFSTHRAPMKLFSKFFESKKIPVKFIGVQARETGLGERMSGEVENAVFEVAARIRVCLLPPAGLGKRP